jgi:hypothetical protein
LGVFLFLQDDDEVLRLVPEGSRKLYYCEIIGVQYPRTEIPPSPLGYPLNVRACERKLSNAFDNGESYAIVKVTKGDTTMKRSEIKNMNRQELVAWLEGSRGVACFDDESTELLRETALEDFDDCAEEEGFAD